MSKRIIESMRNFHYFKKLHNTRRETCSKFFSRFFLSKIPKPVEIKKTVNNFVFKFSDYKSLNLDTSQDIFIKELMKEENDETQARFDINTFYRDKNNDKRNINIMINILNRNKKCRRYFKYNDFNNEKIKTLLTYSVHKKFFKNSIIYRIGSKQSGLYFLIKGKVSLKSMNQELIRRHIYRNSYKLENIYNEIKSDEKFNLLDKSDDDILLENFVSKTNIQTLNINESTIKAKLSLKPVGLENTPQARRSFIRMATFKFDTYLNTKKIVQDKILKDKLTKIQKDLSCTIKTYNEGDFFCDWELIYDKPHTETAYAEEECDILFLPKKYFDKFFSNHYIKADNERKIFLTKRIEFLHINNVINLKPYFFDKDEVIYTQFDIASEFFIVYKGKGALMELNDNYIYRKRSDIIFNVRDLRIICYVGEGCVVGLESFNDGTTKYENNFVIMEENTIIYRVKLATMNMDNYFQKKNKIKLKKQLNELYISQSEMLPKTIHIKRLTYDEKIYKKKEEKINGIFYDAKAYFWKRLFNEKKIKTVYGDLNQVTEMNNKILSNLTHKHTSLNKTMKNKLPTIETESSSSNFKRRSKFHFLTTINKSKIPLVDSKGKDKDKIKNKKENEEFKMFPLKNNLKLTLDSMKSNRKESIIDININNINNNIKKKPVSKRFSLFSFNFKSNLFNDFKQKKEEKKIEETKKEDKTFDFYGDNNNDLLKTTPDLKIKKNKKLTSNLIDEYITKTIKINKNDINYNSGNFRIPLFGSQKSKK